MSNLKNLLTWNCVGRQMCPISIKLILDYKVKISNMIISGITDVNKYLPLIQIQGEDECRPGQTSFGGEFDGFQLYRDYYPIELKEETNILSFNICLKLGEEAVVYNIEIFDVYGNKILVQENCERDESQSQEAMSSQISVVVVVTISAVLLTTILIIVVVYLASKTAKQQKFISSLSKQTNFDSLALPLIPKSYNIQESDIYDSIGTHIQPMEQSTMSRVDFIENQTLYGNRITSPHNVVYGNRNKVNSSESFSEYNNLKHL